MLVIKIKNIQAIREGSVIFGDKEIVEFIGDNSNGKSIITKFIKAMCEGNLFTKKTRRDLINKDETVSFGEFYMIDTNKNKMLGFILYKEGTDSIVVWGSPDNPQQRRGTEGGLKELIYDFGFRVYQDGEICLQIFPTWGLIPFITTKGKTNAEMYNDLISDKVAEEFLKSFEEFTYPMIKIKTKEYDEALERLNKQVDSISSTDYRPLEAMLGKLEDGLKSITGLQNVDLSKMKRIVYIPKELLKPVSEPDIPRIIGVPNLNLRNPVDFNTKSFKHIVPIPDMEFVTIPKVNIPRVISPGPMPITVNQTPFMEISKAAADYIAMLNNRCPTCGQLLVH